VATLHHWQYYLFVFVAAVGVLQLVAAYRQWSGLSFFRNRTLSYLFSFLTVVGSFVWFFGWENRMDTAMRRAALEGAQQFVYFNTAAFLALVFTLIVSSLLFVYRKRTQPRRKAYPQGFGALGEISYLEALRLSFGPQRRPDDTAD
jgi:chromate transport protein ChrA